MHVSRIRPTGDTLHRQMQTSLDGSPQKFLARRYELSVCVMVMNPEGGSLYGTCN